jgi:hypothetical protein
LRLRRPGPSGVKALCALAESFVGVAERTQNRGTDVDFFVSLAGGRPASSPPWCAYFVSAMCELVSRCGHRTRHVTTGRAVGHWQLAEPDQRIERDDIAKVDDVAGLVFVRTRMSKPEKQRERALGGDRVQGHTGICVRREGETIVAICGNSSGRGHAGRTGGVAVEKLTPGSAAWARLVGFVRVVES